MARNPKGAFEAGFDTLDAMRDRKAGRAPEEGRSSAYYRTYESTPSFGAPASSGGGGDGEALLAFLFVLGVIAICL